MFAKMSSLLLLVVLVLASLPLDPKLTLVLFVIAISGVWVFTHWPPSPPEKATRANPSGDTAPAPIMALGMDRCVVDPLLCRRSPAPEASPFVFSTPDRTNPPVDLDTPAILRARPDWVCPEGTAPAPTPVAARKTRKRKTTPQSSETSVSVPATPAVPAESAVVGPAAATPETALEFLSLH